MRFQACQPKTIVHRTVMSRARPDIECSLQAPRPAGADLSLATLRSAVHSHCCFRGAAYGVMSSAMSAGI